MKLAVMTWYHYRNYGTALQAAALTSILRDLGHEPQMIRYTPCGYYRTVPDYSIPVFGRRIYRKIRKGPTGTGVGGGHFCDGRKDFLFENFLNQHIRFTDTCPTAADLERLNDRFDAFVCGSDQIWSPLAFDPKYYLNFVHDSAKKIAYAPSMGVEKIEDPYIRTEIASLLKQFGTLSIRETAGQKLIRQLSGRDAPVVLDPTLLLTAEDWEARFHLRQQTTEPYLLVYMLGCSDEHWDIIRRTAAHLGLRLRIIPVFKNDLSRTGCVAEPVGPEEFLRLFYNSAYVCTDSFHGMIFSLLFHKPFTAFSRFRKTDTQNQNSRIMHLLNMVGMRNRLLSENQWQGIAEAVPDFLPVDSILSERRRQSLAYLDEALQKCAGAEKKSLPVGEQNSICSGCGACAHICPTSAIRMVMNEQGFLCASVDPHKCIHCGKCTSVCPFCTEAHSVSARDARLSSFKSASLEVLLRSTSGGAAYSIAKLLLQQGYYIAGCQYNTETQRAEHILVHNTDELAALQGSKYIQSDFSHVLTEIRSCSRPVAIFGTPCQIAGARRLFSGRTDLVYIDLVCHGVPSAALFQKYREHISRMSGVEPSSMSMSFRHKPSGWADIHLYASDGKQSYCCSAKDDPFFRLFELGCCYNDACYECRWRSDSEADIRLADYWGPRFKGDHTGVSMVACFTQRGLAIKALLEASGMGTILEQPITDYLTYQQSKNIPKPVFHDALLRDLKNKNARIADIAEKYTVPLENRAFSRREYLRYLFRMLLYRDGYTPGKAADPISKST